MSPASRFAPFWLLAPSLGLLMVFFVYPLVFAARTSFLHWDLLNPPRDAGLDNYRELFASGELVAVLGRTLGFSLLVVAGSVTLGLALALALHRPGKLAAAAKAIAFSLYIVSWVSVALLWLFALDPDTGLPRLFGAAGLSAPALLGSSHSALATLAGISVWKISGYCLILFAAGLESIDPSHQEAALLDGASAWARFRFVTWPALKPTVAFVIVTTLILSTQAFDVVRLTTEGGPARSTSIFVYAIYEQLFLNLRVGLASATVMVFFAVLLLLSVLQWAALRRRGAA